MASLEDQISSNKIKSVLLMLIIPIVLVLVIFVIGRIFFDAFTVLILGTMFSLLWTLGMYYGGHKLVLASVGAKESQDKHLNNIVEGLCIAAGMPQPKVYIQDSPDINAFATGRDPKNAIVCVTTGCLEKLNKTELEGVVAHELSHVKNYDMRFMTIVVALVGAISVISQMFLRSLWYGRRSSKEGGILVLIGIVLAIAAPIAATLVQLAISRRREYLADASGAHMTRYPEGLASALEKIGSNHGMKVSSAVAPLYISTPFAKRAMNLLSTHPPLDLRIRRLREM